MKTFDKKSLLKFSPLLIVSILFIVLAFVNPPLFKSENDKKIITEKIAANNSPEVKIATGSNSVNVNVDNSTNIKGKDTQGTCTVTKNGKTETVPAGSVNVNEKSTEDIDVKVNCDSSSSTSNQTSIKNDVNVQVNTSN
jgi:hypothetical protein